MMIILNIISVSDYHCSQTNFQIFSPLFSSGSIVRPAQLFVYVSSFLFSSDDMMRERQAHPSVH